jgi:hypothetical protein
MVGGDDEVTLEHALAMYRGLPEAELAVVPGTLHEKPARCNTILVDFLMSDAGLTIAPVRRAAPPNRSSGSSAGQASRWTTSGEKAGRHTDKCSAPRGVE